MSNDGLTNGTSTDGIHTASEPTPPDGAPSSAAAEPIAPESAVAAGVAKPKKKKASTKKKKGTTRKSKAPSADGTLELTPTPSTAAPPVVAIAATEPPAPSASQDVRATDVDPDDVSVPPVAEDLDHDFFHAHSVAAAAVPSRAPVEHIELESRDPRLDQLMTAEAKRRRAHFTKYVKAAVAISLVLCLAAVVRVGIRRNHGDDSTPAMAATSVRQVPVAAVPEPPKATAAPIEPPPVAEPAAAATPEPTASATAEPAKVDEPAASASAAPAAAPEPSASAVASAAPSAEPPAELDPKAAAKEKRQSQLLLDQGKIADSIAHGEASVKLDPTDAEAWLILGAAYQMKGDQKEARRCFASCIREGKRGPKGECMAMPH